jgi:hypothetical protein
MCTSCKPEISSQEFNAYENKYYSAYCTNDIRGAEKALLDGLKAISEYQRNYTVRGTDFDGHKASFHERLFLIYQATHETNKMDGELRQSIEYVNRSRQAQHLPLLAMTDKEFAGKLENLDHGKDVHWKTNK